MAVEKIRPMRMTANRSMIMKTDPADSSMRLLTVAMVFCEEDAEHKITTHGVAFDDGGGEDDSGDDDHYHDNGVDDDGDGGCDGDDDDVDDDSGMHDNNHDADDDYDDGNPDDYAGEC